eukprot:15432958-Alexandrium_andersonii.AAC.1
MQALLRFAQEDELAREAEAGGALRRVVPQRGIGLATELNVHVHRVELDLDRARQVPPKALPAGLADGARDACHVGRDPVHGVGQAGGVAHEGVRQPVADPPTKGPAVGHRRAKASGLQGRAHERLRGEGLEEAGRKPSDRPQVAARSPTELVAQPGVHRLISLGDIADARVQGEEAALGGGQEHVIR